MRTVLLACAILCLTCVFSSAFAQTNLKAIASLKRDKVGLQDFQDFDQYHKLKPNDSRTINVENSQTYLVVKTVKFEPQDGDGFNPIGVTCEGGDQLVAVGCNADYYGIDGDPEIFNAKFQERLTMGAWCVFVRPNGDIADALKVTLRCKHR